MTRVCTVRVGPLALAIAAEAVQEVAQGLEPVPVPLAPPVVAGLVNLRGHVVTALDLRAHLRGAADAPAGGPGVHVIVPLPEGPLSLVVDDVGDVLDVGPGDPPPDGLAPRLRALVDRVHDRDDAILLRLDPTRHARHARGRGAAPPPAGAPPAPTPAGAPP